MTKKKGIVVTLVILFIVLIGVIIVFSLQNKEQEPIKKEEPKIVLKELKDVKEFFDPKLMDKDVKELSDKEAEKYLPQEDDEMDETHGCEVSYRFYSYNGYVIELAIDGCYWGTEISIIKDDKIEKSIIRVFSFANDPETSEGVECYPIIKDGKLYYLSDDYDTELSFGYVDLKNALKDETIEKTKFISSE